MDKQNWVETGEAAYEHHYYYSQERCDLTELLVSECACHKHKLPDNKVTYNRVGSIFTALYDNRDSCECGNEILEGDEACYIDDELSCGDCGRKAQDEEVSKFTKNWGKK